MRSEDKIGCAVLLVIAAPLVLLVTCGLHIETSVGERTGVITKLSRKGVIAKTWEGSAIIGSSDVPGVGTTWDFTIEDGGPVDEAKRAMDAGVKVRMHYTEFMDGGKVYGDTNYRLRSIEVIAK